MLKYSKLDFSFFTLAFPCSVELESEGGAPYYTLFCGATDSFAGGFWQGAMFCRLAGFPVVSRFSSPFFVSNLPRYPKFYPQFY
jgi:hypothetical protein